MSNALQTTGGSTTKALDGGGYGSVASSTDPTGIFLNESFESYSLGSDPDAISGFSEVTSGSVISDEQAFSGTKSYKDVSRTTGSTEWANGFIHSIPSDLVQGDEAWVRMHIYIPAGSDITAPGEGDRLKWLRWRTESYVGANTGYSDVYYHKLLCEWRYIKEVTNSWKVLATGVGGAADMEYGKWVTWEFYTKFHTTAGIIRMWKDGVYINEFTDITTLTTATDTVTSMYFRTYWNGGIPEQQDWYYDNVAIALNGAGRTDSTQLNTDSEGNLFIGAGV